MIGSEMSKIRVATASVISSRSAQTNLYQTIGNDQNYSVGNFCLRPSCHITASKSIKDESIRCQHKILNCSWKIAAILSFILAVTFLLTTIYLIVAHSSKSNRNHFTKKQFLTAFKIESENPRLFNVNDAITETVKARSVIILKHFVKHKKIRLQFRFTSSARARFVIFGKKGLFPTVSRNDFVHVFDGEEMINPREITNYQTNISKLQVTLLFVKEMTAGIWYLSIYNEGQQTESFTLSCDLNQIIINEKLKNDNSSREVQKHEITVADPTFCRNGGFMVNNFCMCKDGWHGKYCNDSSCNLQCIHGNCVLNKCRCDFGFNGRFCEIDGCRKNCSGFGLCIQNSEGIYYCSCDVDRKGSFCQQTIEKNCANNIDDDDDGLTDCNDPNCCVHKSCRDREFCMSYEVSTVRRSYSPYVLRRYYFLIGENGQQRSADPAVFDENRTSLIIGRVFKEPSFPYRGVKIQAVSHHRYGYVYSDENGMFFLLVNGGKSLILWMESPDKRIATVPILVPWNEIIRLENFYFTPSTVNLRECKVDMQDVASLDFNFFTFSQHGSFFPVGSSFFSPGSQALKVEIPLRGFNYCLTYTGDKSENFRFTIAVTGHKIPERLTQVHIKAAIEGVVKHLVVTAEPLLYREFIWPEMDVFDFPILRPIHIFVSVGYEFFECDQIFWTKKSFQLNPSSSPSKSFLEPWKLSIHHRLLTNNGVIHLGNGDISFLPIEKLEVKVIAGVYGQSRALNCDQCTDSAGLVRFLKPSSVVTGHNGEILIADYNYVWLLMDSFSEPRKILELKESLNHKYYLSVEPIYGQVYVSDPVRRQILRIRLLANIPDLKKNYDVVIGNGKVCISNGSFDCIAGRSAKNASLSFPKGLAFGKDGTLFFVDGSNVYYLSVRDSIVKIFSVHRENRFHSLPSCESLFSMVNLKPRWPSSLAINPVDDSLYALDDFFIVRITDNFSTIIAGIPPHCNNMSGKSVPLKNPLDISFNSNGDLFILEMDENQGSRIKVLRSSGELFVLYDGNECKHDGSAKSPEAQILCEKLKLIAPLSITVHPSGAVLISDGGSLEILSIQKYTADIETTNHVKNNDEGVLNVFDRKGYHVETRSTDTGEQLYKFSYREVRGKPLLSSVHNKNESVNLTWDSSLKHVNITSFSTFSHSPVYMLKLDEAGMLDSIYVDEKELYRFYYKDKALLSLIRTEEFSTSYIYDDLGRISKIIEPNGNEFEFKLHYFFDSLRILQLKNTIIQKVYDIQLCNFNEISIVLNNTHRGLCTNDKSQNVDEEQELSEAGEELAKS